MDNLSDTPRVERKVIHTIDTHGTLNMQAWAVYVARTLSVVLVGVLCLYLAILPISAYGHTHTYHYKDYLKMYAHFKIVSDKQYKCFYKIITKESGWSPAARNGSHYGLGQMRSKWYGSLNGFRQIEATIEYIAKRYGDSCSAWAYHRKIGWY